MKHVLIISGHTDLTKSVATKKILETFENELPEAEILRLDSVYPDFNIDTNVEQQRVVKADIIVFQFPVHWYNTPSLLSRWFEKTFIHGFSHGSTGDKLKGKKVILSVTAGAPNEYFSENMPSKHSIDYYMSHIQSMCAMTKMEYIGCIFTGGVSYINRTEPQQILAQETTSVKHAEKVINKIKELL